MVLHPRRLLILTQTALRTSSVRHRTLRTVDCAAARTFTFWTLNLSLSVTFHYCYFFHAFYNISDFKALQVVSYNNTVLCSSRMDSKNPQHLILHTVLECIIYSSIILYICCWVKTPHSLIILVHFLEEYTASIIRVGVSQVMKVAGYTEEEGKKLLREDLSVISG